MNEKESKETVMQFFRIILKKKDSIFNILKKNEIDIKNINRD